MRILKLSEFILLLTVFILFLSCQKKGEQAPLQPASDNQNIVEQWDKTNINGMIQLPDKDDHSGILVFASGKSLMAFTDKEGRYTIMSVPLGTYQIEARMDGYNPISLGALAIEGTPQKPASAITLPNMVMEKSPDISGESLGGLFGKIELDSAEQSDGALVQIQGTNYKTVSDAEGMYRFYNLPSRSYTLQFSKAGYISQTTSVNIPSGDPVQIPTIRLIMVKQPPKVRTIYGTVELRDLKNKLDNRFDTVVVALEGASKVALLDSEGKFVFENITPGKYTLTAVSPFFRIREKEEVDLKTLEYINVGIIMDEIPSESSKQGSIKGFVHLSEAEDHSGATIALAGTSHVAVSDSAGQYTLSGLPAGTYTVLAQAEGYVPETREGVEVRQGEEFNLDEISLKIRVTPPEIIYTDPGDEQTDVMIQKRTPLYVRFNKNMRPDSLRRAFSIRPAVDYRIYSGRESRYSDFDLLYVELSGTGDKNPLSFDTQYTVTISSAARDYQNIQMEEDYTFTFSTGKASVTGSSPDNGEKNAFVNLQHPMLFFFNASIDPRTLTNDNVDVSPSPDTVPQLRIVNDPETGWSVLRVFVQLQPGTNYRVRLQRGIRTDGGSYISNLPFAIQFRMAERRDASELEPR
ncbi:MAG TPA: carboxypeptidase regulatory-like domain-containing protein [Candidatus Sumerlaeota bacterium]|nr:MAG: Cna protein B-type domain protein [candidate division BRC1 bacterium ADurb.Bin183]HOE63517.1 carboxypeptidase regulatory-like domain-containing protein [Candidatus Sumerlaeota bacterium]HRR31508.1 carboxypeptidase regulatory-like domain-containing protein [Candidatus Sumerlaeia bacterium]HON51368.1 carboxypeptidase regulatory-like domain-containing protein [Candidatus Sumerlaeota bacterium]HOR64579.1 carboxypeptidase regulatory-like domain-containing protein [Candidatus Sumerlaeota bact